MVCYIASDKWETPNLMSCAKGIHGSCTRCGQVGANHFVREPSVPRGDPRSAEDERRHLRTAFFKAKRSYPPHKKQARLLDG